MCCCISTATSGRNRPCGPCWPSAKVPAGSGSRRGGRGAGRAFHPRGTPHAPPDRQRIAAALAATEWTTILTGGPGTGKTHTVARILALLHRLHGPGLRVALCAPTGKAAATLTEAVAAQAASSACLRRRSPRRCTGYSAHAAAAARFRFNARNRLPYDVVVVDETSMVSLTLMARLLEALRPQTRLMLIGDPDQLTSVEAGAVLADLVNRQLARPATLLLAADFGGDLDADADGEEPRSTSRSALHWPRGGAPAARPALRHRDRALGGGGARRRCRGHAGRARRRW